MLRFNFFFLLCSLLFSSFLHAREFKVAALYWSMNIEGQVAMRKGLEEEENRINAEAKKMGTPSVKVVPYVAGDGDAGIVNQVKQMNEVVSTGNFDLIIVQPTDNAALTDGLKLANIKNIPVIAYDQYIIGGELVSYVTSNNYQAGTLDGEYLASKFKDDYEMKLILVEYPNVSSTVERVDGLIDALKKSKQRYRVIKTYNAVEPVGGKLAGESILKDFPKKGSVDAIFTINDGGGLSLVDVLYKAGRKEIIVGSIDGDPRSVKNIKEKRLTVIDSAQFCGELGRQSLKNGYKYLNGQKVAKKILIPTFPITSETLSKYPGWLGHIPEAFEKPWLKGEKWDNRIQEF